jgi:hypothetical protein
MPDALTLFTPLPRHCQRICGKEMTVYHFDLYRIKNEEDLYSTGFYDYPTTALYHRMERAFRRLYPEGRVKVKIEFISDTERRITLVSFRNGHDRRNSLCRGSGDEEKVRTYTFFSKKPAHPQRDINADGKAGA